jgi:hypothetical protein
VGKRRQRKIEPAVEESPAEPEVIEKKEENHVGEVLVRAKL